MAFIPQRARRAMYERLYGRRVPHLTAEIVTPEGIPYDRVQAHARMQEAQETQDVRLQDVSKISLAGTGYDSAVARDDGTVWVWGDRWHYDGNYGRLAPTQKTGLPPDIVQVSMSQEYSSRLALTSGGVPWVWGQYLGAGMPSPDPNTTGTPTPIEVTGLPPVKHVEAAYNFTMYLATDGTLWSAGRENDAGELGRGHTLAPDPTFAPAQIMAGVAAVSAMSEHTVALKSDGTVWAWGSAQYGKLGIGPVGHQSLPVQVSLPAPAVAVAVVSNGSVYLLNNGDMWYAGDNWNGQAGTGTAGDGGGTSGYDYPVQSNITGVEKIWGAGASVFARKPNGETWAWGVNWGGQLGHDLSVPGRFLDSYGNATWNYPTPHHVPALDPMVDIAGGMRSSRGVQADCTIWGWGENDDGEIVIYEPQSSGNPCWVPTKCGTPTYATNSVTL